MGWSGLSELGKRGQGCGGRWGADRAVGGLGFTKATRGGTADYSTMNVNQLFMGTTRTNLKSMMLSTRKQKKERKKTKKESTQCMIPFE